MNINWTNLLITIVVAICAAVVTFFTSSCASAEHYTKSDGHTSIITTDTTNIHHGGNIQIKIK